MRYVIRLDDGSFIKHSVNPIDKRKFVLTGDELEAEVWVDAKAAAAFCEEKLAQGASIIPIDIPVMEMVRTKPKVVQVVKSPQYEEAVADVQETARARAIEEVKKVREDLKKSKKQAEPADKPEAS